MNITLHKDKTTKGAVRFKEQTDNRALVIYIEKARVAELGNPEVISMTIEKVS